MGTVQPVAGGFLSRILRDKEAEIRARRDAEPITALRARAERAPAPNPRTHSLRGERLRIIAEVKRGSPSAGTFDAGLDAVAQSVAYAEAGAAAVSILTDGPYFQGSLDDLSAARQAVTVPLLRKDFILDPYQVLESRAAGADLVLLIVAALDSTRLRGLLSLTHELGMEALVEVNTEAEARQALQVEAALVGINNRNLETFVVDLDTTSRLRPLFPDGTIVAGLSGIRSLDDARRLRAAGVDAVLVGEALVRAADPRALLAGMTEVI